MPASCEILWWPETFIGIALEDTTVTKGERIIRDRAEFNQHLGQSAGTLGGQHTKRPRWYRERCYGTGMDVTELLATIDAEIARVQDARAKIVALIDTTLAPEQRTPANAHTASAARPKRQLSPEGRARIAEAQRRRHAARQDNAVQEEEV